MMANTNTEKQKTAPVKQAAYENVLEVKDLVVRYILEDETVEAVNGISFSLKEGQTIGLVGEPGAGKTSPALAILNLVPDPPGVIQNGTITICGKNVLDMAPRQLQKIRGKDVSMIFQDPMTSLNPVMTVGDQIAESIRLHENATKGEAFKRAQEMLEYVGIPAARAGEYPHQFSGGMKQRVGIAIALACNPTLLLADEPTTALDVTIQAQVLDMMNELKEKFGTALVMITHDLGVVAKICDHVAVMYAGRIIETGTLEDIFSYPMHPYTEGLFNSLPNVNDRKAELKPIPGLMPDPTKLPAGCAFAPRCQYATDACREKPLTLRYVSDTHAHMCTAYDDPDFHIKLKRVRGPMGDILLDVRHLTKYFKSGRGTVHAVDDVSFTIEQGRTLGIVGESGCGKSTTGRCILRLIEPTSGQVFFMEKDVLKLNNRDMTRMRRKMQIVFQDPYSSLNPRKTVLEIIAEPLKQNKILHGASKAAIENRVLELMETVGLAERLINTYPHELDGGRRQRIGIARALAVDPKFIVCDEPVSALDVSIQAQILNLLKELQRDKGLTYIFITHDLSVVNHFSDDIMVMYLGQIVEMAPAEELFADPRHPYTKALLSAILIPEVGANKERIQLKGEITSPLDPPDECRFAKRCNDCCTQCKNGTPPLLEVAPKHYVACHLHTEQRQPPLPDNDFYALPLRDPINLL